MNYLGNRQLKLECLKQAVIATNSFTRPGRDTEVMRIAKVMFDWVLEPTKDKDDDDQRSAA
jgi:hypothetical protein